MPPPGTLEIVIIGAIIFILFGAKKIPEFARGLGKAQREFQQARVEVTDSLSADVPEPKPPHTESAPSSTPSSTPSPEKEKEMDDEGLDDEDEDPEARERRKVIAAAKELGIDVEGRSLDDIKADLKQAIG